MDVLISEFASTTYFQTQNNEDPLIHGYVSSDRVAEFTTKYIKDILRPLLPDLNYEPKESTANVYVRQQWPNTWLILSQAPTRRRTTATLTSS